MKRVKDVPDRIVLNASTQKQQTREPGPVQHDRIRVTTRTSKEVLDSIPHTISYSKPRY